MEREIVAWGNSLGLRIPNKVFQKTAFSENDPVTVEIVDGNTLQIKRKTTDTDDDQWCNVLTTVRNWIRFHILGRHPFCPTCGSVMVPSGRKPPTTRYYKCPKCNSKEKSQAEGGTDR